MEYKWLVRQGHQVSLESESVNPIWQHNTYLLLHSRPAYKRINAVDFTSDSSFLLAADKFGDVYKWVVKIHFFNWALLFLTRIFCSHSLKEQDNTATEPVTDKEGEEKKQAPIVGHVSMVTDMVKKLIAWIYFVAMVTKNCQKKIVDYT